MNIKQSILLRTRIAFVGVSFICFLIAFRILYIQLIDGERWEQTSIDTGLQYRTTRATRGNIYSANGELLATSIPLFKLSFDPTIIENVVYQKGIDSLCILLSNFFQDNTPAEYKRKINNARTTKKRYLILNSTPINYHVKKTMEKWPIFREGQMKGGILFEKIDDRSYPYAGLGKRMVGYINEEYKGVVGLEISFEEALAGIAGQAVYQRISGGEWKPITDFTQIQSQDGYDIHTTIDMGIQEIAHNYLKDALLEHQGDFGCVIVMEVQTGHIKAMVNLGKEKKGDTTEYIEKYNYAIGDQGSTDPGSTFKLASMLALFEDSPLQLKDSVNAFGGTFGFYGRVMRDTGGYGLVTAQKAFELSSSIGVSRLVVNHFGEKPSAYIDYLYKFGLGNPLGFQLLGESDPYIKTPSDATWSGTTLPWMSVGYELKIAPIHTLAFYNAVANKGKLIQPIIVKSIKQANQTIQSISAKVINPKICSDSSLQKANVILQGVVERGTATAIKTSQYKIAGKTGTSQKIKNGRYVKEYYTSFCGFFPADAPRYTMIVVIDSPKGKYYGADVAAPVFRNIADKLFIKDLEIQQNLNALIQRSAFLVNEGLPKEQVSNHKDIEIISQILGMQSIFKTASEWVIPIDQKVAIDWEERKINQNKVPNLIGMSLRDALFLLENRGFKVHISGQGRVKSQSIMPGSNQIANEITLVLE